jgi:hypothetical protein
MIIVIHSITHAHTEERKSVDEHLQDTRRCGQPMFSMSHFEGRGSTQLKNKLYHKNLNIDQKSCNVIHCGRK